MAIKVEERLKGIDRRIEKLLKSQEESFRKSMNEIRELKESQKKTDEQLKKTDEQIKKTDEQLKKTHEQLKKTDKELRAMFKKTDEEFEKTRKLVTGISDGWGRLTEGFAIASVEKIFSGVGIPIKETFARVKSRKDGRELELDLLSVAKQNGEKVVIIIEVKTYLKIKDVDDLLDDINKFYEFFDGYENFPVMGGIAFMTSSSGAKTYAEKQGFYLFALGEDVMTLANSQGFKPRIWKLVEMEK